MQIKRIPLMGKRSKGAYLAVEQMILFAIGVAILIGISGVYSSIKSGARDLSTEDQFREVAELTLTHIIYVYNTGLIQGANVTDTYIVPEILSDTAYEIRLTNHTVFVVSSSNPNFNHSVSTLGLNQSAVTMSGNATSFKGKVKVNYNSASNSIFIETAND